MQYKKKNYYDREEGRRRIRSSFLFFFFFFVLHFFFFNEEQGRTARPVMYIYTLISIIITFVSSERALEKRNVGKWGGKKGKKLITGYLRIITCLHRWTCTIF